MTELTSIQRATLARNAQQHAETEALIEEFELLKGSGRPRAIAVRMGYTKPSSLARRFARYGRLDLARGLWD